MIFELGDPGGNITLGAFARVELIQMGLSEWVKSLTKTNEIENAC